MSVNLKQGLRRTSQLPSPDAQADCHVKVPQETNSSEAEWQARLESRLDRLESRLDEFKDLLQQVLEQRTVKDWYSTEEIAQRFGKAEYTVRQWCCNGRIHAVKKGSGRGKHQFWAVSREELSRYEKEGLLPAKRAEGSARSAST